MTEHPTAWLDPKACDLADFDALIGRRLTPSEVPLAAEVAKNIPLYDMAARGADLAEPKARAALLGEWAWVLGEGPGVLVLKVAYADTKPIDRATKIYREIIAEERAKGSGGDHFAAAGANDRIWNSAQKLCLRDPECFALYFGNAPIAAACEAWLGPDYQMTAQVNQVRPGGAAQKAHRDYHLGFQTAEGAARFPAHVHALTAALTLQGAVAHCDMPLESGPTKLLPYSQLYPLGYLAFHRDDFRDRFEQRHVQLPLAKGDAVFFNPALFHAAGANTSKDIERMANLLQISSAFGRAMEALDRDAMAQALYPALQRLQASGALGPAEIDAALAAAAEGYSFPTNLDTDPPVGGLAPESQAALMRRALAEGMSAKALSAALKDQSARRRP